MKQCPLLLAVFLLTIAALPRTLKTFFSIQTVQALFRDPLHKNLTCAVDLYGTYNLIKT